MVAAIPPILRVKRMMAGRFCTLSNLCTILVLEIAFILSFWVADYWVLFFSKVTKPCDVTNSSIVRKVIQKNWSPVLNKYGVALPLECPLNLSRDMLAARESIKKTRSSYWQCVRCGKKFYLERHLDLHIERRHPDVINHAEDSVCLGEFCDVMRCDVLKSASFLDGEDVKTTDVSVWTPLPKDPTSKYSVTPLQSSSANFDRDGQSSSSSNTKSESNSGDERSRRDTNADGETVGVKGVSKDAHSHEPKLFKTPIQPDGKCDEAYFTKLREKCSNLVWQCLQGLITVLDVKEFKALQNELEQTSCSYLSCSRYGDACCSPLSRHGKLRPFFIVFGSLVISLFLALAYYFTWIYTQSGEEVVYYDENKEDDRPYQDVPRYSNSPAPSINRTTHI